jgi:hypothetical protein
MGAIVGAAVGIFIGGFLMQDEGLGALLGMVIGGGVGPIIGGGFGLILGLGLRDARDRSSG